MTPIAFSALDVRAPYDQNNRCLTERRARLGTSDGAANFAVSFHPLVLDTVVLAGKYAGAVRPQLGI